MRSYYAHLETASAPQKTAVAPKPTFRSSAIFPMLHMPGISSRVIFMGYWILKRNIKEIASVITLRTEKGEILSRKTLMIQEPKTYSIELNEHLINAGLNPDASFIGSLEVEFYSTANLVFPYPAVAINYYGPKFSSVVHTAQRIYNDYDDMQRNSQTQVPESGFNIYADDDHEPFLSLINGGEAVPDCKIRIEFYNIDKENLSHEFDLGTLGPYETRILYPGREVNLKDFLKGKVGAAKAYFHVNWIFPRLIAGNIQRALPAVTITHTYYDCTNATSDSDYWYPPQTPWHTASLMVPVTIDNDHFTNIYFYPIYSPSTFTIDVEIYDQNGNLLGEKPHALTITSPEKDLLQISFKKLCEELGIKPQRHLAARIIGNPVSGSRFPARVKLGLDIGSSNVKMPCNICTNLQPFNPPWDQKPTSFKWAPILADQPYSTIWIMNSSPSVNYKRNGEAEITFYREKDTQTVKRNISIPPHGFIVISPNDDEELRQFFEGHIGWFTLTTTNPYTTTFYLAENPSGVVGGDHGF